MSWHIMADGHEMSLHNPVPDDFEIKRAAHSLAQINRFNGNTCRPYSVAEHSLLCAEIAEEVLHADAHGVFACLMHDLHEVATGDQITPSKDVIGPGWAAFEHTHEQLVRAKFSLHSTRHYYSQLVHTVDRMALAVERDQLLPHTQPDGTPSTPWPVLQGYPVLKNFDLMHPQRVSMTWADWRDAFIERHGELEYARKLPHPLGAA
jgi:hypothetical protein